MGFRILALGGDGIGPEVVDAGLKVIDVLASLEGFDYSLEEDLLHGAAWDAYGTFLRDETLEKARHADAVLVGAVGGANWDDLVPNGSPVEKDGLMKLRRELDVYAGLRPARAYNALLARTPFKTGVVAGANVMVVRELCGGPFFGEPRGIETSEDGVRCGFDNAVYSDLEIERIARVGFELARRRSGRLVSADKANVMESYVLWREVVTEVGARDYPDVKLIHLYADNAVYQLCCRPNAFEVILSDNLFGDILSDLTGSIAGSLGMLPSASLASAPVIGERVRPGLYEPVHGTAPDITGQGIANPLGAILSVAMMFEHGFAMPDVAQRIEVAVDDVLNAGIWTPDLGGSATTVHVTDAIISALRA